MNAKPTRAPVRSRNSPLQRAKSRELITSLNRKLTPEDRLRRGEIRMRRCTMSKITVDGDVAYIKLGGGSGAVAVIDARDVPLIADRNWLFKAAAYKQTPAVVARKNGRLPGISLARAIARPPKNKDVRHWDFDGLNCRRSNLVICSRSECRARRLMQRNNTSGYRGVYRNHDKWKAVIRVDDKPRYLGTFTTAERAAEVYDEAAVKFRGTTFAMLNFPPGGEARPNAL